MNSAFSIFCLVLTTIFLESCTYNVSMAHTEGFADDVIDDTASNTPNISPNLTIPMTPASVLKVNQ